MSRETCRDFADSLPQIVCELDPEGKITFANRNAFNAFGYTREDFEKGLNALQMLIPEDRDRARENIRRMLNGEKLSGNEYTAQRKDGTTFPVLIYSSPLLQGNKPRGLRAVLIDISELKQAEAARHQSEEKLRAIIESSPDAITVTDLKGNIIECNRATLDLHGFSTKEELIGKSAFDLIAPRERQKAVENLEKTLKHGSSRNTEYTVLTKDGREFSVELSASVIRDTAGKPTAFVAITKDITERKRLRETLKESEERYRILVESSPNLIGIYQDGALKYANKAMCEKLGWTLEELTSPSFNVVEKLVPKRFQALVKENIEKRLSGGPMPTLEVCMKTRSGSEIPIMARCQRITYLGKPALEFTLIDLTEMKRLVAMKRASKSIAHDLQDELAAIKSAVYNLTSEELTEKGKRMLELIDSNLLIAERTAMNFTEHSLSARILKLLRRELKQLLPPSYEFKNVAKEVTFLFDSAKHKTGFKWSVIIVGLAVMAKDASAVALQSELGLHRITVYRALGRLQKAGFLRRRNGLWTLNEDKCPILYWLTRRQPVVIVGRA